MSVLAEWNDHVFEVSPKLIKSFFDMTVTGSVETKKVQDARKEKVMAVKNGNPRKVTMTAVLSKTLGCTDIQEEAMMFVTEATTGEQAYLYVGGEKLVTCYMMLTQAKVTQIELTNTGEWTYCQVALQFEQSSKLDGQKSVSKGKGKKQILDRIKGTIGKTQGAEAAKGKATVTTPVVKDSGILSKIKSLSQK